MLSCRGKQIAERFWAKVNKAGPDECWLWTAAVSGNGYGMFLYGKSFCTAHRVAWQLVHGPVLDSREVCHRCDTPLCCNPLHLFIGTHRDNMRDAAAKGRKAKKLTGEQVVEIRRRYAAGETQVLVAKDFPVTQPTISRIVNGKLWSHLLPRKGTESADRAESLRNSVQETD